MIKGIAVGAQETRATLVLPDALAILRERCVAFLAFANSVGGYDDGFQPELLVGVDFGAFSPCTTATSFPPS